MDFLSHSPLSKSCHCHLGTALGAQLSFSFRCGGGTSSGPSCALQPSVQGLLLGGRAFYNEVPPSFSFFLFKDLFIYFWLCWVFVATHKLSLVVVSGSYSLLWCMGFFLIAVVSLVAELGLSVQRLQKLQHVSLVFVVPGL